MFVGITYLGTKSSAYYFACYYYFPVFSSIIFVYFEAFSSILLMVLNDISNIFVKNTFASIAYNIYDSIESAIIANITCILINLS